MRSQTAARPRPRPSSLQSSLRPHLEWHVAILLLEVAADDELYASYFWWKDFYEVRNSRADLSQSFCALCAALHGDQEAKVYSDLTKWWVTQSRCKKLHLN